MVLMPLLSRLLTLLVILTMPLFLARSEERFSRNAETDLVCRLLLEKKKPLATISHMLDCQLYGLKAGGHHATNVILHTIAVLLLFRVLREMTGAVWKSTIVAALFAVHPLHVESVAWVSERKDVLSAVFFLLMLNAYVRYARAPSMTRYLLVAVLFAAGLMSKPMLITAPVILLLLDYWPLRRFKQYSSTTGKVLNSGKQLRTRQR